MFECATPSKHADDYCKQRENLPSIELPKERNSSEVQVEALMVKSVSLHMDTRRLLLP